MLALREHITKYPSPEEAKKNVQELKIHMHHFEEAMKKIRPLSTQELSMYERISEQFRKPDIVGKRRNDRDGEAGLSSSAIT
jgi:transitional endoplasmic reticulum ATPase